MPGSSFTDPMPLQERSPAPTAATERGQGQALAAGRRRDVDEDWEELTFKMRRSGGSGQRERDGQEEEDVPMIMNLMCEVNTEDQKNMNHYKEANLEETFDWGQHPRMSWAARCTTN